MTLTELKKAITEKNLPSKIVFIDQNHTLLMHYLDNISEIYNRKLVKVFGVEEANSIISTSLENPYTFYAIYLQGKDINKVLTYLSEDIMAIAITDEEEIKVDFESVLFSKISRNACLAYLENYLLVKEKLKNKAARADEKAEYHDEDHYISQDLLEELVDYFDCNLDNCLNEINKVKALGLTSSWDKPFRALLDLLPKKDQKLRSLKWFSGGDIDTCQVLYNIYMKKLKNLNGSPLDQQYVWAKLVKEAIWCEACIVSGTIGDYVTEYLQLVESSLPSDFEIEYFPPVFYKDIITHPEYHIEEVKQGE